MHDGSPRSVFEKRPGGIRTVHRPGRFPLDGLRLLGTPGDVGSPSLKNRQNVKKIAHKLKFMSIHRQKQGGMWLFRPILSKFQQKRIGVASNDKKRNCPAHWRCIFSAEAPVWRPLKGRFEPRIKSGHLITESKIMA
jgi:hypothetical protein